MMDRRQGRAQRAAIPETQAEVDQAPPHVTRELVAYLDRMFPPATGTLVEPGLDGAVNLVMQHAQQRGREEVIRHLFDLTVNPRP